MIKRVFLISLVFAMVFSLVACSNNGAGNTNNTANNVTANDQEWVWIGPRTKQGVLAADGYYYIDLANKNLSYADLTGKGSLVLCTKVGCTHDHANCEAHISTVQNSPLFFYEGNLYYVDEVNTGALYRRDATGSNFMEIGKVGEKYIETKYKDEDISWKVTSYMQAGEYMYYCAQLNITVLIDENKPNAYRTYGVGSYIGRIHLGTGKDEVLIEQISEKTGVDFLLCAASQGRVLFLSSNGVDVSPEDETFAEAYRQMPVTLNSWSEDTGEITKLFTKTKRECFEIQLVVDGKLYYATQANNEKNYWGDLYAYDLKTGTEEMVGENAYFLHYGGGYALRRETGKEGYALCNLKTGEVLPQEIENPLRNVRACSNDGCVLQTFINEEIPKEDGTTDTLREMVTYYVPYASLADGMQESDLVLLFSQKMGHS